MTALLEADTLLAIDVGTINTRASLFDVVDGRYRIVATARATTTGGAPLFDISEGVRMALEQLRTITGRRLVDESEALIMPSNRDGSGVDLFVATASAGPRLRTVLIGLMPGISFESAHRLAASTDLELVEEIGLMDRRREEHQIDAILAAQPDLVLIVGGTDGGAGVSVLRMVETASLAAGLIPEPSRPRILYAGNRQLAASVVEAFGDRFRVTLAPNLRPSLEQEALAPARRELAELIAQTRASRVAGFDELTRWSGGYFFPTAEAFGRVVRYLSRVYDRTKGVLGVDLGASHTTVAAALDGELRLSVHTDLGLGGPLPGLLKHCPLPKIMRWLPIEVPETEVLDYLHNKSLHPGTVPSVAEELHIELALARQLIRSALFLTRPSWPANWGFAGGDLMIPMEPIIAGGAVLARAPRSGYAALALLDALQPVGISTLVLDPYALGAALGAAAGPLPMAAVQVLESGGFVSLGTVVAVVGRGKPGRPALRLRLEPEGGGEGLEGEVRYGQLVVLPLPQGQYGRLTLRPERGFDVGFGGPGKAGVLRVGGGAVGLIIDARGRPIWLPGDPARRRDLNQKWLWDIGALT